MATPPKPLLEPVPIYPLFEPNQLLSARELNRLGDYLDQQDRSTRVCLIGVGILCGLVPRRDGDSIEVSAGIGLTSEGFLVRQQAVALTHSKKVKVSRGLFLPPGASTALEIDALELTAAPTDQPLTAPVVAGKVLALVLEYQENPQARCLEDCDEKGTERLIRPRWLLLDAAVAGEIALDGFNPLVDEARRRYPGWSLEALLTGCWRLPDAYLERFGCGQQEDDGKPDSPFDISDHPTLLERYSAMIATGKERVDQSLAKAHWALSPLFVETPPNPLPPLPAERFDLVQLQGERALEIQYVYAHLADLIRAYEELREAACELMDACCNASAWFPMYLLLGPPLDSDERLPIPPSPLRTPYAQPPVYNGNQARAEDAWLLFERLRALIGAFDLSGPSDQRPIRITPSRWGDALLGERAIPYYYKPAAALYRLWSPERHRRGRSHCTYGYAPVSDSDKAPFDEPFRYDFEGHDFYRIEGHVGHELSPVRERILKLRERCNLAFDVVEVKLGKQPNDEDFHHECEFRLLQVLYTKLRTDLACALLKIKPTDPVKALLDTLVEQLDDFNYLLFKERFDVLLGDEVDQPCLEGYDGAAFAALTELHKSRRNDVLQRTLLHQFAGLHPGLEHRGGVPRGGTFVLVYDESRSLLDDRQKEQLLNRFSVEVRKEIAKLIKGDKTAAIFATLRQTVVADFCLPYLCCSDCPPTAYVLARPRPTFAIQPMAFCADDETEYDFVVDPVGGVITGPGTRRDGNRYYFVPSLTGLTAGGIVEVVYTADGADRTLTLQIRPRPQATFDLRPSRFCQGDEVQVALAAGTQTGGELTTDIDPNDPKVGLVVKDGQTFLDMKNVPIGETFNITYSVEDNNGCKGRWSLATEVPPLPDAAFTGLSESYCDDQKPTQLIPTDTGLSISVFSGEGVDDGQFVPNKVGLVELQRKTVTVIHKITNQFGCTASLSKQTTVYAMPPKGTFEAQVNPPHAGKLTVDVQASGPAQPRGDPWQYVFYWRHANGRLIEGTRTGELKPVTLTIALEDLNSGKFLELAMRIRNGPCEGEPSWIALDIPFDGDDRPRPDSDDWPELDLVRERRERGQERLAALAAERSGLVDTNTYRQADALLKQSGTPQVALESYEHFVSALRAGYSRLSNDARKETYRSIAEIATIALVDRLAVEPSGEAVLEQAKALIGQLVSVDVSVDQLRDAWLADDMAAALDPERIEKAKGLFG